MEKQSDKGKARFQAIWRIQLMAKYHLDSRLFDELEGCELRHLEDGTTVLGGRLPDMCAVYGLMVRMRDMAVEVISLEVHRQDVLPLSKEEPESAGRPDGETRK